MANSGVNMQLYPSLPTEDTTSTVMELTPRTSNAPVRGERRESSPLPSIDSVYTIPVQMAGDLRRLGQAVEEHFTQPPAVNFFGPFSMLSLFISFVSFFCNYASDVAVAYFLRKEHDTEWWFWLTLALILVPNVIVNGFSFYWYRQDEKLKQEQFNMHTTGAMWLVRTVMHCLTMGTILRYTDTLYYGFKSRKSHKKRENIVGPYCRSRNKPTDVDYYSLLLHEERDTSTLELMQSFTRDAPQFALQMYILATRHPGSDPKPNVLNSIYMQYLSATISIIALSWSLVSFNRALRFSIEEKVNLTIVGSFFQFLWRLFVICSRIISLVLFATKFRVEFFIVFGIHWAIMAVWIIVQRTNFCGSIDDKPRRIPELIYNVVMGWVFVFCYINVKDAPSRYKYLFFYVITFTEDVAMIVLWYLRLDRDNTHPWYSTTVLIGVPVGFAVGIMFMLIYYRCLHPAGKMPNKSQKASLF